MDLRRFQPSRRSLGTFATGGAWFFIVVSILHVLWAIAVKWDDPAGTTKLYHTVVGDVSYDALWLTYTGSVGLVFAVLQLLAVTGAAVLSTLPFDRTLKARRVSHLFLCGWSALWALNIMRLAAIDARLDSAAQAALLCVLFGCTVWRAASGWSPGPGRSSATPTPGPSGGGPPATPALDEPDEPSFSARVAATLDAFARGGRIARRKAAGGLNRVADFARRQAARVAPNTGK